MLFVNCFNIRLSYLCFNSLCHHSVCSVHWCAAISTVAHTYYIAVFGCTNELETIELVHLQHLKREAVSAATKDRDFLFVYLMFFSF